MSMLNCGEKNVELDIKMLKVTISFLVLPDTEKVNYDGC